jgi:hypothetical protein
VSGTNGLIEEIDNTVVVMTTYPSDVLLLPAVRIRLFVIMKNDVYPHPRKRSCGLVENQDKIEG